MKQWNLSPKELKRMRNACRLFLKVITVADITDGKGNQHPDRRSRYKWPNQPQPPSAVVAWRLWRKTIQRFLVCTEPNGKLRTSLGFVGWSVLHCTKNGNTSWTRWKDVSLNHSTENGIFKVFPRLHAAQTLTTTIYTISFHRPYLLVVPVMISAQTRDMFEISGVLAGRVAQPSISPNFPHFSSKHSNIDCLHPMLKSSLGDYPFPPNIERFQRHLRWVKLALLASDGSLADDNSATQGWKLHSRIDQAQASGHGYLVGGAGAMMSSLRLEVGGFLARMLVVDGLLSMDREYSHGDTSNTTSLSVLYIDNWALISRIKKWPALMDPSQTLAPDHDFIQTAMLPLKHIGSICACSMLWRPIKMSTWNMHNWLGKSN